MSSGHVIDRLLAMVLTVYLARVLGPAALGVVGIGMTLPSLAKLKIGRLSLRSSNVRPP